MKFKKSISIGFCGATEDINNETIVYIIPFSSLNNIGKVFFKCYILNDLSERNNLEDKPNFLLFPEHI